MTCIALRRHRRVWALAWPIMLANLSVPLVGAVDTAVVGHLDDAAFIGGVALGALTFSVLFWGFGFLRMGTTGFVAQSLGAGERLEIPATVYRGTFIALLIGTLLIAATAPLHDLALIALQGSDEVEQHVGTYLQIRIWSAPAVLFNYVVLGTLIGLGRTRPALVLQLVLNGTNALLDVVLVSVFDLEVRGVAIASLCAEIIAAAVGALLLARCLREFGTRVPRAVILDPHRLRELLSANVNILVRTLGVISASFWFTALSARGGDTVLAANAVLLHFHQFAAHGLDGFAHAAEALTGRAYGASRPAQYRHALRGATLWCGVAAALYTVFFAIAGGPIIEILTGIDAVRLVAREHLAWVIALPLVSVWSFLLDGVYVGCGRTAEMRNGMLFALVVFALAAHLLVAAYANHGLWAAMAVFLVARAAPLWWWMPRIERAMLCSAGRS